MLVLISCVVALLPGHASAKGPVDRLTVAGGGLVAPFEVTDPAVLAGFDPWGRQFIAWDRGPVAAPPDNATYTISFYLESYQHGVPIYVVRYVPARGNESGFIYVPGRSDPEYRCNVQTIMGASTSDRWDPTGGWQRSTREWDAALSRELVAHGATSDAADDSMESARRASQSLLLVSLALAAALIGAIRIGRRLDQPPSGT